jgi:hypothetical protein
VTGVLPVKKYVVKCSGAMISKRSLAKTRDQPAGVCSIVRANNAAIVYGSQELAFVFQQDQ